MPRRKSLTKRLIQHLLLISLARTILTAIGRGRAWDEWDERKLQTEPAEPRKHTRRFVQALSFCAIFCAGLALSAGAGNGVYSLLEDGTSPAATGASGPSGATGVAGKTPAAQPVMRVVEAEPQAAPARPTAVAASRVTAKASAAVSRPLATPSATAKKVTAVRTHVARPSRAEHVRPHAKPKQPAPKAPALDPEAAAFPSATVWLNRAAPDPTPPAARLKLSFARDLVRYSRAAHVDWALVLATLRAEG